MSQRYELETLAKKVDQYVISCTVSAFKHSFASNSGDGYMKNASNAAIIAQHLRSLASTDPDYFSI